MRLYINVTLTPEARIQHYGFDQENYVIELFSDTISYEDRAIALRCSSPDGRHAMVDMREFITLFNLSITIPPFSWVPSAQDAMAVLRHAVAELTNRHEADSIRRQGLGLNDKEYDFPLHNRTIIQSPIHGRHKLNKKWAAVIKNLNPGSGSFTRQWMIRAAWPSSYKLPESLKVGDAIEFGADRLDNDQGHCRVHRRWYGYVVRRTDSMLILGHCADYKDAFNQGVFYAALHGRKTVVRRPIMSLRPHWEL